MVRRRSRRLQPALEAMEDRQLLSTAGINLKMQVTWAAGGGFWVDIRNALRAWSSPGNDNVLITSLTPDGYPTVPARTWTNVVDYPNGVYPVSYSGTASLAFSGAARLTTPFALGSDGLYHGAITIHRFNLLHGIACS